MVFPTLARMRETALLLASPPRLIDLLLDRLDELRVAMLPAEVEVMPCREFGDRTRFD
jgi:hypothetical protein